jgi:hypothetical protein
LEIHSGIVQTDIENLREQAEYLNDCLERLRKNLNSMPDPKEARWLETMMESSWRALQNHIKQLEKLEYKDPLVSTLFKR